MQRVLEQDKFVADLPAIDSVAGPELYTDLLGQAAQGVLQADPDATITGLNLCTPKWNWYERSIDRGLFKHINAMGIHGYGTKTPEGWIDVIATMRSLQKQAGVDMPIIVWEYGTQGGPEVDPRKAQYLRVRKDHYKPPRIHAAELARVYAIAAASGVQTFTWYRWRRTSYNPGGEDIHGLTRDLPSPHPLPALLGYNTVATMLDGFQHGQRVEGTAEDVYVYVYRIQGGEIAWAAWTTSKQPVEYELDISAAAGPVTVRPLLGPVEVKPLDKGAIPLRLTREPIFLRAKGKSK